MRRFFLAFAVVFAVAGNAFSAPQGYWPPESRGLGLPTPDWILVVPAKREPNGSIKVWDRQDPWTRAWVVPQPTPTGTRTVAIAGDAEDRRTVADWHIDHMDVDALKQLAMKYSAPAIAVVVEDETGESAVAAWTPDYPAVWELAGRTNGERSAALQVIGEIFSGHSEYEGVGSHHAGTDVSITGQRPNGVSYDYRLAILSGDAETKIQAAADLEIVEYLNDEWQSIVVRGLDGRDIETILRSNGITFE